jgi:H+/Cl- antiporter ClcA
MGTAALVLGILAIVLAFIPILGFASWPLAILGIIFGFVGVRRVAKQRATNKGVALGGLILSIIGLVLVIISTVLYVSALNSGVQSINNSLNAQHRVTYKVTTTDGSPVTATYSQGKAGSGSVSGTPSPWSVDTTVTGSVATLTAAAGVDVQNPNRSVGITCSIVDDDTGKTVATNTVPPSPGATVSCNTTDLGTK